MEGWLFFEGEPPSTPVQILVDGAVASTAAPDGTFHLGRVGAGRRVVMFRALGLGSATVTVSARSGESALLLAPFSSRPAVVTTLPGVRTVASMRAGFDERRRRGQGYFVDRSTIERVKPQALADLLRGIPGVKVVASSQGYRYLSTTAKPSTINSSTATKTDIEKARVENQGKDAAVVNYTGSEQGCDLMIYVDGLPFTVNEGDVDVLLRASDIVALEVYTTASSVPRQFAGFKAACGVVLIWRT